MITKEKYYEIEAKKTYDRIAKEYHKIRTKEYPAGWFYNELLEMPTTLKLLGDVRRKKILDVGCGTGIYAKILTKRGAKVRGVDISEEMLKIARKENPKIEFKLGSAEKLPYKNKEFDIVLSALTMEYLPKWGKALKEIRRVLKPNGIFVFSITNPVIGTIKKTKFHGRKFRVVKDYFREGWRSSRWKFEGRLAVDIKWHHKTYGTIVKAFVKNGFEIVDYEDAYPLKKGKKLFLKHYKLWTNMPYFCVWKVRKKGKR